MNETKAKRPTPASRAASIRFSVPRSSMSWKDPPLAMAVAVDTTVSASTHARSSESGSVRSPSTTSAPYDRSRSTLPGSDVERTSARSGRPLSASSRQISPPSIPVAPTTRFIEARVYAGCMPFADVYPLVSTRALARTFTYEVTNGVRVGSVVAISIHGASRRAVVVRIAGKPPAGVDPALVQGVVDEIPAPLVELALWLANYYGSTPGRALALVAPERRSPRGERPRPADRESLPGEAAPHELTPAQR